MEIVSLFLNKPRLKKRIQRLTETLPCTNMKKVLCWTEFTCIDQESINIVMKANEKAVAIT